MNKTKTALLAAATWLENNQSRHIIGSLAVNSEGMTCDPVSEEAECFCALGRFTKELGVSAPITEDGEASDYDGFSIYLRSFGIEPVEIFGPNDRAGDYSEGQWDVERFCKRYNLSGPDGVKALRDAAAKIPDDAPED